MIPGSNLADALYRVLVLSVGFYPYLGVQQNVAGTQSVGASPFD